MLDKQAADGSDITGLAEKILLRYGIKPISISVLQGGSIKTVWKIKTRDKILCLKRLKQTYDKALFSVNAQIYIKNNGGKVPGILPDTSGSPLVQHDDQLFVLYEWIEGRDISFDSKDNLELAVKGLAEFHITTRGYVPPEGARVSSKLDRWPEQYMSMMKRMSAWTDEAAAKPSSPGCSAYLKTAGPVLDIARTALELLDGSGYKKLVSTDSPVPVLCHQDFGKGNAIYTPSGLYVLDLDGVSFDLPARDLRKIIGKLAENRGQWKPETIQSIVDFYNSINPMSREEKKVLYIDLLFPHWFFGLVKNQFANNKPLKGPDIERIAKLELSKVQLLKDLLS